MSQASVERGGFRLDYTEGKSNPFLLHETSGSNADRPTWRVLLAIRDVQELRALAKLCNQVADFAELDNKEKVR